MGLFLPGIRLGLSMQPLFVRQMNRGRRGLRLLAEYSDPLQVAAQLSLWLEAGREVVELTQCVT